MIKFKFTERLASNIVVLLFITSVIAAVTAAFFAVHLLVTTAFSDGPYSGIVSIFLIAVTLPIILFRPWR